MAHPPEYVLLGKITFFLVISLLLLCWTTVILRLWVRLRITRSAGWDDACMVASLLLFTSYSAFILVITMRGSAEHIAAANILLETLTFVQLAEVFYILTTTMLKISLGLFFLRVLTKKWQARIFYSILAISAVYGFIYVFITIFQCGDPVKLADGLLNSKNCLPSKFILTAGYLYGIINVIADWTFVLVPIVVLLDSDMDRRSKISVSIVMALGAVGSISSILRMVYLKGLLFGATLSPEAIKATIWATAEPGTGIIAASIAILRPLCRKIATDVKGKISEYGTSKESRMDSTAREETLVGTKDSDSMIALTTVATAGKSEARGSKKMSMYSVGSDESDPWSPTVTIEQAQMGKMMQIQMSTETLAPRVPPKP